MAAFCWKVLISDRNNKMVQTFEKTEDHPLKKFVVTERIPRKFSHASIESQSISESTQVLDVLDPLREFALKSESSSSYTHIENENTQCEIKKKSNAVDIWNGKKAIILNKYTTANKIVIVSSCLSDDDKIVVKNHNPVVDKVQNRLEQLDWCGENSSKRIELTQAEYISKIYMLNKDLVDAWNSEQRVKAVKIAIQCAKLLADTDVMSFYPSKFVLITEVLDVFGSFVYERLKQMAQVKSGSSQNVLPEDFSPDMVSDMAKETCLNWFHKIASIRELVPRLYIELAIVRSYNFISETEGYEALLRITKMINGIGNPLVAVYARCYLCKLGETLPTSTLKKKYLTDNLYYIIKTHDHIFSQEIKETLKSENLSMHKYLDIFSPALDFIMEIIVDGASESLINDIFRQCLLQKGKRSSLLNSLISVVEPSYVANRVIEFLEMLGHCEEDGLPNSSLLCSLGLALSKHPPPSDLRKPILLNIGKYSNLFKNLDEYICFVESWMLFIVKNFKIREVNTMLGDIIVKFSSRKDSENFMCQLKNLMIMIVQNVEDFESLFTMNHFLPFLDLFHQDSVKIEMCKMILVNCKNDNKINDPIVISALSFLCAMLHDSVDALTPEDELKQIGLIICNIIRKVDYGRDFEQQLEYYVEARGTFSNIDSVLIELVQKINTLMVKTRYIVHGFHSKKTADFVRACAAYCFITIPSISCPKSRLQLYLLSSQVALYNQCLGQADACLRAALSTIPEYEQDDTFLVSYIKKLLSFLLIVPDDPDFGVLSLVRYLLNTLQRYEWSPEGTCLISIYLSVLNFLSMMAQDKLPYYVDKVQSNDTLYGGDEKFISEINKICSIVLVEVLNRLKELGPSRKQSLLMFDLFICIMNRCDLTEPTLRKLVLSLWQQCTKHGFIEGKLMLNTTLYYKSRTLQVNDSFRRQIVESLI